TVEYLLWVKDCPILSQARSRSTVGSGSGRPELARPMSQLGRFDSLTRGHPNGGNGAQTRRSGRPGRTAESGGNPSFPIDVAVDASHRKRTFAPRPRGWRRGRVAFIPQASRPRA